VSEDSPADADKLLLAWTQTVRVRKSEIDATTISEFFALSGFDVELVVCNVRFLRSTLEQPF
jgi:hypothetical protein